MLGIDDPTGVRRIDLPAPTGVASRLVLSDFPAFLPVGATGTFTAIGGVFIPLSQAPATLATLSQITPHSWFIRGINTLSGTSPQLGDIAPSVVVLVAMGLVTGAIGLGRARRSLVP